MAMEVNGLNQQAAHKSARDSARSTGEGRFFDEFKVLPEQRFRTTDSGLKIATVREGQGPPLASGQTVKVHYAGWTGDGQQFDSSMDKGRPFGFRLGAGRVIQGWEEGLAGIKAGERRQLIVPAKLAYGDRQVGDIPPGSTLIFNVEAVEVGSPRDSANPKGTMSVTA